MPTRKGGYYCPFLALPLPEVTGTIDIGPMREEAPTCKRSESERHRRNSNNHQ